MSTRTSASEVRSATAAVSEVRANAREPASEVVVNCPAYVPVFTTAVCATAVPVPAFVTVQRDRLPVSKSSLNRVPAAAAWSTTRVRAAGVGSTLPALSVASTLSRCRPSPMPPTTYGEVQVR